MKQISFTLLQGAKKEIYKFSITTDNIDSVVLQVFQLARQYTDIVGVCRDGADWLQIYVANNFDDVYFLRNDLRELLEVK